MRLVARVKSELVYCLRSDVVVRRREYLAWFTTECESSKSTLLKWYTDQNPPVLQNSCFSKFCDTVLQP